MSRITSNQSGFGVIGIVVAVVAIFVISGSGYLVYKAHTKKSPLSTTSSSSGATGQDNSITTNQGGQSTVNQQGTILDLKEAGVELTLSSSVSDATYAAYYSPSTDGATVYGFSTKTLQNAANASDSCSASHGALGIIRVTSTVPEGFVPPNSDAPLTPDNKTLFKIGNSYYQYVAPQNLGCTGSGITPSTVQTDQTAIAQSFVSLQSDSTAQ